MNRVCTQRAWRIVLALILSTGFACERSFAAELSSAEFHRAVYALAEKLLANSNSREEIESGEYAGAAAAHYRYEDSRYYDMQSGLLLARIRRDASNPQAIHIVEVNIYGADGKLQRDFGSVSLPWEPSLAVRTMINLHHYPAALHSFRQFDMYGDVVYESCVGRFENRALRLSLEGADIAAQAHTAAYHACFDGLSTQARAYLDPN